MISRSLLSLVLLGLLAACTVSVVPHRVVVTADKTTVRPGETVTLTAEPNYDTPSRILWSLGPEDARDEADVLEPGFGPSTRYTAPLEDGSYTVYADAIDDEPIIRGSVTITVDAFLDAERYAAGTDRNAPILSGTLAPGASRVLIVESNAAAGASLTVELGQNLELRLYDDERDLLASSRSSAFFGRGRGGLSSVALAPQGIAVARACRGACVIQEAAVGESYVRVTNSTSQAATYTLFAYVGPFDDSGEDANDAVTSAPSLSAFDQGAIETLGDEDHYRIAAAGDLVFSANGASSEIASGLRAEVAKADGAVLATLRPGQNYDRVIPGDTVRIFEEGGDRAGAAAASRYALELIPAQ